MMVALTAGSLLGGLETVRASTVEPGNVTTALGPSFFVDDAVTGGGDAVVNEPAIASYNRSFAGQLNANQGPARVMLTGFGFATSVNATANDATSLTVSFTYLGADEAVGGGDDVFVGSETGSYVHSGAGEYLLAFDNPMSGELDITGVRFLIEVAPTNGSGTGSVLFKTAALTYEAGSGPKFSVAGSATPLRVNLAKYQPVTTDSVSGQRLASYLTDGIVGNDNRWQSMGNAPHWARVDFPFPVEVGSAQVFSGQDDGLAMTAFKLQYLNGSTWQDIPGGTVSGNTSVERNITFGTPVTASAFRLFDSVDGTIRVRELALYPPNGGAGYATGTDLTLDLARKRQAVATANTAGNFALLAVDGRVNKDSMWQTSLAGANELEIDLRVVTRIGSAHLYSGSPGLPPLSDFVLRYWDGGAWLDIPGGSVAGNTSPARVVSFSNAVSTDRVRLVFTNGGTSSVQELCLFPANNLGGYPIGTDVVGAPVSGANYDDYSDAFYHITNSAAGLQIADNNGFPVLDQAGLTTAQGQYQVLLNVGSGTYRLRNRSTGLCLSGTALSKVPGGFLVDAPYSALPDQDWQLRSIDGTNFHLVNLWSGLVIDTHGGGTAAGTPLVQNVNTGAATQRWQLAHSENFPKKGAAGATWAVGFDANWAYNWGLNNASSLPPGAIYDPMQWGSFNWGANTPNASLWKMRSALRTSAESLHLLGFNEPDGYDQSGKSLDPANPQSVEQFSWQRSADNAVSLWPRLQAMDVPLVSPSPANMNGGWLASFYTQAADLGYRVDYTALHTYPGPSGGSSDNLINTLQSGHTTWGRPVWLTEFSFVNWSGTGTWTEEDNYNCLAEFLWRAESLPWLRKYSLFVFTENGGGSIPGSIAPPLPWSPVGPRSNAYDADDMLTPFGELYAAWDGDASIRTNKDYLVHNKETRKRLANTLLPQSPNAGSIRENGKPFEWQLVPAPGAGRYYLQSSHDKSRLSYENGGQVDLSAAATSGGAVQWELTEDEHGWFFLEHPATSKRLKLEYNNPSATATFSMVANTNGGDALLWRFIVPLSPPSWTGSTGASWKNSKNWSSNRLPSAGDTVSFDSSSTANLSTVLDMDSSPGGLRVTTPSGPVSIAGVNTLTLGSGGIDLSGASRNLTINAPVVAGAAQVWSVAGGRTLGVNGGVSGSSQVTVTGAGLVSLGGAGSWTGSTTVAAGGTLRVGAADVLPHGVGTGDLTVDGTLDLNGFTTSVNGLGGSGVVDNLAGGSGVLIVGNNDAVVTLDGTLQNTAGTLALEKTGAGNLVLSFANSFDGGFTNNGSGSVFPKDGASFGSGLVVMNAATLYSTGGSYVFENLLKLNGSTLRVGGGNNRSLKWSGPVTVTADSGISADGGTSGVTVSGDMAISESTLTSFANGTANTLAGAVSGSGTIRVTGGTLNVDAENTFDGTWRSVAGTLKIGDPKAFQDATLDMDAADGGGVNLSFYWATIGALTGSRDLNLGTGTVSIGNNNQSTAFGGALTGGGSFTKIGSGTLTLSGPATYAGITRVNAGTLAMGANDILPGNPLVIGNATLNAATFTDSVGTLDVTAAATIHLGNGAALAFADSSGVDWSGGTLDLTGVFVAGSSLRFGNNASGLTVTQLALVSATGVGSFALDANGYLIPVDYDQWASANAPGSPVNGDYDNDGVRNGVEYVLGGDKDSNDLAKLPQVSVNGGDITFSFARDHESIDGTTRVVIEVGTSLDTWPVSYLVPDAAVTSDPGVTVVKDSPAGFDTVTLTLSKAPDAIKFVRLRISP